MVHHGTPRYTMVEPWYTTVHHGKAWYDHVVTHRGRTIVYHGLHGIRWYTMVYHGTPWWPLVNHGYTIVYYGKPWYDHVVILAQVTVARNFHGLT